MNKHKRPSEQWKASLSFWGDVSLAITMLGLLAISFWAERLAQANPVRFWQSAIACCQEILSRCHLSLDALPMGLIWLSVGMLCIGFLYACSRSLGNLWTTCRFLRYLPRVDSPLKFLPPLSPNAPLDSAGASLSHSIVIFRDDSIQWAFTAGFLRPKIYLSIGLIQLMTSEELRGVMLHEVHHCMQRDALKTLLVSFLQDLLFFLPISRIFKSSFIDAKERAADEYATLHGIHSLELASALIKLAKSRLQLLHGVQLTGMAGEGEIVDRIQHLLGKPKVKRKWRLSMSAVISSFAWILLVSVLLLPIVTSSSSSHTNHSCGTTYCQWSAAHYCTNRAEASCQAHCRSIQKVSSAKGY